MAKEKTTYVDRLVTSHKALLAITVEKKDFTEIQNMAKGIAADRISKIDPTDLDAIERENGVVMKCAAVIKRYDTDIAYLQKQRMYYVGKALEERPTLFDSVLATLVS